MFVAAAAAHRRAAFEGADQMMDWLKSRAPFWKKAHGFGRCKWIEPRAATDYDDAARWDAAPQRAGDRPMSPSQADVLDEAVRLSARRPHRGGPRLHAGAHRRAHRFSDTRDLATDTSGDVLAAAGSPDAGHTLAARAHRARRRGRPSASRC